MSTETIHLAIPAIHCDGCLKTVRKTVEHAGAQYVSGDADVKRVSLEVDAETVSVQAVVEALEEVGFAATVDGLVDGSVDDPA